MSCTCFRRDTNRSARRAPRGLDILEGFPSAQRTKPDFVLTDISPDFCRVCPCVLPQSPADSLPQKEFPRIQRRRDTSIEKRQVSLLLELELAEDGGPSFPYVVAPAPLPHLSLHLSRMLAQQLAKAM